MNPMSETPKNSLNWGILSTANIGVQTVIPAIQQSSNGKVVAIASRSAEKAASAARQLGIPKSHGSYEELLESPDIDAVYIPLPNAMHHEWVIRAAEHGKHILCEKSISVTPRECQEMISACNSNHVRLMEAFMYRFHPQYELLRAELASGTIGKIILANSRFSYRTRDESDIRFQKELGGGSLLDVGCYCVNAGLMVFGEKPVSARAWSRLNSNEGVDEMMIGQLQFPGDRVLSFECGFLAQPFNSLEVIGTKGTIRMRQAFRVRPEDEPEISIWIDERGRRENPRIMKGKPANQYTLMAEHFSDCVLYDKKLAYPPSESLKMIESLEMIQHAQQNF
jgi:D-xylose 1-dehydrogenase (NADP+, D-xylono-1,5-lactone-forming)